MPRSTRVPPDEGYALLPPAVTKHLIDFATEARKLICGPGFLGRLTPRQLRQPRCLLFGVAGHSASPTLSDRSLHPCIRRRSRFRVPERRDAFHADLSTLVEAAPFALIAVVIDKRRQTVEANPYLAALDVGLIHVTQYLRGNDEKRLTHVIVESRGKREDEHLERAFAGLCSSTGSLDGCNLELVFASKQHSHCGLQLADLVARPIGRHVINPAQRNRAYEILSRKFWGVPKPDGLGIHVLPVPA